VCILACLLPVLGVDGGLATTLLLRGGQLGRGRGEQRQQGMGEEGLTREVGTVPVVEGAVGCLATTLLLRGTQL
jgi:hypothetical protein